jgi:hypothetical protein
VNDKLVAEIEDISKKLGLELVLLDAGKIEAADIEKFNDFAFLNEYINERLRHPEGVDISTIERERTLSFAEKYGTEYVNLSALIYSKQRNRLGLLISGSVLCPLVLPYTLSKMIAGEKNCHYLNLLYNLKTDELMFSETYNIRTPGRKVNSYLYHTFHQVKAAKK